MDKVAIPVRGEAPPRWSMPNTLNTKRWPTVLNSASPLLSDLATAKVKGEVL